MITMWLIASTLALQSHLTSTLNFNVNVATSPAVPSGVTPKSVVHDETAQVVYLAGYTNQAFEGQTFYGAPNDAFLTQHHLNGSRIWSRIVGGSNDDYAWKVAQNLVTRELFIFGQTYVSGLVDNQPNAGGWDTLIVKYAQNGTKLLTRVFGTVAYDQAFDVFVDASKQRFIVGGIFNNNLAVTTHDINNASLLNNVQVFSSGEDVYGIVPALSDQGLFATGDVSSSFDGQPIHGAYDLFLTKWNFVNGTRYWSHIWGNTSYDFGCDVQYDPSSHLVFVAGLTQAGSVNGQPEQGQDALLICTSDNGTYLWTRQFADSALSMTVHQPTGTLFVVGLFGSGGFVSTFSQNGTMIQLVQMPSGIYQEVTAFSSNDVAYIADVNGGFVAINVSWSPPVIVSNLVKSVTTTPPTFVTEINTRVETLFPLTASLQTQGDVYSTILSPSSLSSTSLLVGYTTETPASTFYTVADTFDAHGPSAKPSQERLSIYLAIGGGAALAVLVITIGACLTYRCQKVVRGVSFTTESTEITTDMTSSHSTTFTTQSQQPTSMTTLMRSTFELSLPAYLMFKNGPSFRIRKQIAKGGGGVVYVADAFVPELKTYGPNIIVKSVGLDSSGAPRIDLTERQQKSFKQEISIMHFFREQKHIAKLLGWCNGPAYILMKLYPLGSLDKWIRHANYPKNGGIQLQFMRDISHGIKAMHETGFVHCDLKPPNVLIDNDVYGHLFCCLTDFGVTQIVEETSLLVKDFAVSNVRGLSVQYAAPEAFLRFRMNMKMALESVTAEIVMKVDLYSLGVIMLEILNRRNPWG